MLLKAVLLCLVYPIYSQITKLESCGPYTKLEITYTIDCFPTCQYKNQRCPLYNIPEPVCVCIDGYMYISKTNKVCIMKEFCPEFCTDEHFKWNECGSACPPTCQDTHIRDCGNECKAGCFCENGYLIDTHANKCVKREECNIYG